MRCRAGARTGRLGERGADHGALSGIHLAQLRVHIHTCVLNIGIYYYVWRIFYVDRVANAFVWRLKSIETCALNQAAGCSQLSLYVPMPDLLLFRGSSQRDTKCRRHTNAS